MKESPAGDGIHGHSHENTIPIPPVSDFLASYCPGRIVWPGCRTRGGGGHQGRAGRAHGVVARGAVRHVHPLGALCRARRRMEGQAGRRHRRMDHEPRENPGEGLREVRRAVQPDQIRRRGLGAARPGRRDEIPDHHLQAPRRLRDVRQQGEPVQHRGSHAIQARSR